MRSDGGVKVSWHFLLSAQTGGMGVEFQLLVAIFSF